MKLAAIFQNLEHLNDFIIFGYGGHFVFSKMRSKFFTSKTFADQDFPMGCSYILKLEDQQ